MAIVLTAEEAVKRVPDGATIMVNPVPSEEVFSAFKRVFEATGHPKDITIMYSAGLGPFSEERKGMNHFAVEGMLKRVVAGHIGLNHLIVRMIAMNQIEAYNLPQGSLSQLYRDIAAKRIGHITTIGLGTFIDPRLEGGKMNDLTRHAEDLVKLIEIEGQEHLFFKAFPGQVGIIRGTTADPRGNITSENESIPMENLEVAMAVHNSGGMVIAQVERLSDTQAHPKEVSIPGVFVDVVVVAQSRKNHPHSLFVEHDPSYTGEAKADLTEDLKALPLGLEKVICRRAGLELREGMVANLGIGIPMSVASIAFEEGLLDRITLNTELGVFGGLPQGGVNFGPAKNPESFISQPQMFDFYEGGGIELSCIGLAQADKEGNVNVSKLGPKVIGAGGFINITQTARCCCFCGEFTAGGLKASVQDGGLIIHQEGKIQKFIDTVQQITFSGRLAREKQHKVLFITERCVFKLVPEGLLLCEVAPGIDVQRDVLGQMGFRPIVPDEIKPMNPAIFREPPMHSSAQA